MKRNIDTVEEYWNFEDVDLAKANNKSNNIEQFETSFADYVNARSAFLIPSARWGLYYALSVIQEQVGSGVVLVPSFNCSVVKDAIERSGHVVHGYDFSGQVGRFVWDEIVSDLRVLKSKYTNKVVALIVTHYFGIPTDFEEIIEICNNEGIYIIEDCSHMLGGKINGKHVGTHSDVSVYSFNYDKPISLGWGGALVVRNKKLIHNSIKLNIDIPTVEFEYESLCRFISAMQLRRKYINKSRSILSRILRKVMRQSNYISFEMPQCGMGLLRAKLGLMLLERYDQIKEIRNDNAKSLKDMLPTREFWFEAGNVETASVKLKMNGGDSCIALSKTLQLKGYRVGNYNWPSLIDVRHNSPYAFEAATNWVDVPIHQNMSYTDVKNIAKVLERFTVHA